MPGRQDLRLSYDLRQRFADHRLFRPADRQPQLRFFDRQDCRSNTREPHGRRSRQFSAATGNHRDFNRLFVSGGQVLEDPDKVVSLLSFEERLGIDQANRPRKIDFDHDIFRSPAFRCS